MKKTIKGVEYDIQVNDEGTFTTKYVADEEVEVLKAPALLKLTAMILQWMTRKKLSIPATTVRVGNHDDDFSIQDVIIHGYHNRYGDPLVTYTDHGEVWSEHKGK